MAKEDVLLKVSDLSVQSAGGRFRDLNFTAARGEVVLFTSADGRKIASLFRVLYGLETPLAGTIGSLGASVGLVLAEDELPAWSKIRHELSLYAKLRGIDPGVLAQLMESWDLEGTYNLPVELLSPYECIAFFLVLEMADSPAILQCQEPLAGLNPRESQKMLNRLIAYAQAGHLVLLGTVNDGLYPPELRRISLDKVQPLPPPAADFLSDRPARAVPVKERPDARAAGGPVIGQAASEVTHRPDAVQDRSEPTDSTPPSQVFGGRRLVTLFVALPVEPATDYELRRIGAIKYFEPVAGGYDIDILEADKNQLSVLLAERGLTPAARDGAEGRQP